MDGGQLAGEEGDHPLGVPQGGGVGGGDHNAPVRAAHRQPEPLAHAGGGVHQDVVVLLSGRAQEGLHPLLADARGQGERGGEEVEIFDHRVGHRRPLQGAAALQHVGEVHEGPIGEAQGDVQVAQADVHVDAQHPAAQGGQTGRDAPGQGGLSRATLTGRDHNGGTHSVPPVHTVLVYHNEVKIPIFFVQM